MLKAFIAYAFGTGTPDLNGDRYIDLGDFDILARYWLECTDPKNPDCVNMNLRLPLRRNTFGYWGTTNTPRSFGPWVLNNRGWGDTHVMFVSLNSRVYNGAPSGTQGNAYYNTVCNTPFADRIWMYISPSGDPYTWTLVGLALAQGGASEDALIGDPSVVYWQGKWHMYYEGTNQCDGNGTRVFHDRKLKNEVKILDC